VIVMTPSATSVNTAGSLIIVLLIVDT